MAIGLATSGEPAAADMPEGVSAHRRGEGMIEAVVPPRLPVLAGVCAALTATLTGTGAAALHGSGQLVTTTVAGLAVLVMAMIAVLTRRDELGRGEREQVTAGMLALLAAVACLHVGLTHRTWATAGVLLVIALAGVCLPSSAWFGSVLAVCWIGWAIAFGVAMGADWPGQTDGTNECVQLGTALLAASAIAWMVRAALARTSAALAEAKEYLDGQSVRDTLTGSANRRGLEMLAEPMIENARRQGEAVHCLYIDIDAFKTVNDEFGFERGDDVLLAVAQALRAATRSTDVVARMGGDEFVVLGPGTGSSPLEMERRVRSRLIRQCPVPGEIWPARISVGSATLVPWDEGDLEALIRRADQDMYLRRSLRRQTTLPRRSSPMPSSGMSETPEP